MALALQLRGTDLDDMGGDDEFDNDAVKFTVAYSVDFQLVRTCSKAIR